MVRSNIRIFAFLISFLFISCGKEEEEEVKVPLSTLIAGTESKTWVMTAYTYSEKDYFSGQKECEKDNHYIFHHNGTFDIYEGETKCNDEDDDHVETSSWKVNETNNEFTWNNSKMLILTLTENKFVLENSNPHLGEKITLEKVN